MIKALLAIEPKRLVYDIVNEERKGEIRVNVTRVNCTLCGNYIVWECRRTPFCLGCQDTFEAKVWLANKYPETFKKRGSLC